MSFRHSIGSLDERAGGAWTLRQLAFHLAESVFYAESVGMLAP